MHLGQFGFTKGVGTVDALLDMRREVQECREKYVVKLFLDILGAFDSAWWPKVLRALREWRCPNNLYCLIRNHFKGMTLRVRNEEAKKEVTKGCPQGSFIGPLLWNVLFGGFLKLPYEKRSLCTSVCRWWPVACEANTSPELIRKSSRVLDMVMR